jgi:hypothetical protein
MKAALIYRKFRPAIYTLPFLQANQGLEFVSLWLILMQNITFLSSLGILNPLISNINSQGS